MKLFGKGVNSEGERVNEEKLQLFLSHRGICSRRKALEAIKQGKVTVNGNIVLEPSVFVDPEKDLVHFEKRKISLGGYQYLLLNKPSGFTTTKADRHAEKTVMDLLPPDLQHLHPVGRLDKDTQGLLILTNDGDLTYQLTHPKFDVDKVYAVKAQGRLSADGKQRLGKGVLLDGKKTAPAEISRIAILANSTEFLLKIHEGRKRQIRRMLAICGHQVISLTRIQQGTLKLGQLKSGHYRILTQEEVNGLKRIRSHVSSLKS